MELPKELKKIYRDWITMTRRIDPEDPRNKRFELVDLVKKTYDGRILSVLA